MSEGAFLELTSIPFAKLKKLSLNHLAEHMKFVLLANFPLSLFFFFCDG